MSMSCQIDRDDGELFEDRCLDCGELMSQEEVDRGSICFECWWMQRDVELPNYNST
jgi:hypothetical protein